MEFAYTVTDRIAEVVMNQPPVNAFNSIGWANLAKTITAAGEDPAVNVVILRAEGRGFCAGVDIKELAADGRRIVAVNKGCYDSFAAVHRCKVPVIAATHGFVLGGGIGLAGAADIIIASEDSYFGLPEIDRGAMGGASHFLRMLPLQKVRALFYTGESIKAAEMARWGAIESVVPRETLVDAARALAAKIAAKSGKALRLAKEALNGIEPVDIERNYRFEQGFTLELYTSPDSQEARDAFVEKRDAKFG
ncbi:enoyl-CoA hydratase family protein [Zavarzinia compransoris]|uniref:Enoyl-CoA hydratase family protein n=1 Tax=Zavarzinia compransoris TaxID=1264899 RepID=A0A317DUM1_9PROT|nr:enoyl-CoA hydratase family protein [Zavarzinia compransoris]PWR17556.1 enoyl-CoA hydratase family protein [Zavarzinia compransoris]TDP49214.1 enoyl-CoA hydratase [Zavarzinia compransoris]